MVLSLQVTSWIIPINYKGNRKLVTSKLIRESVKPFCNCFQLAFLPEESHSPINYGRFGTSMPIPLMLGSPTSSHM